MQLTKSHLETLQFQNENLTLRSSFNKLQNENEELPRSKADAYEEMRTFNNKHHDVLANQDSSTEREKIAPLLQTTTIATTSLREDHLELSSSLNQAYLETISEPKSTLENVCAASNASPDPQQSSTRPKMDLLPSLSSRYTLVWEYVCMLVLCNNDLDKIHNKTRWLRVVLPTSDRSIEGGRWATLWL